MFCLDLGELGWGSDVMAEISGGKLCLQLVELCKTLCSVVEEREVEVSAWSLSVWVVLWWGWEVSQNNELTELNKARKHS